MMKIVRLFFVPILFMACSGDSDPQEMPDTSALPMASFTADVRTISTGESVQFQNNSINAESILWTFAGGDPDSSTDLSPTVTYFNPGSFTVSLLASNASGNHRISETNYIEVTQPDEQFAIYMVTFTGNWSAATHPTEFPGPSDHFSSAVGMVHKEGASLFKEGELASQGIEDMAENGSNGALENEVSEVILAGLARSFFNGGGLGGGTSERTFEIEMSSEFPLVSVVSMIAPSPDWFVAVQDVLLFSDGQFIDSITVEAPSFDSGTDNGSTFTSPNDDSDPPLEINRIINAPLGNGTTVDPPMAYFTFTKKE